ncbi:MAG TPA: hypothetical protein VEQ16_01685 [Acidocella sp.]|nr:hypothetical protein [Acidocella sp.]
MSALQVKAITAHVQPCWNMDKTGLPGHFAVLLSAVTDASGTVREVEVSPDNTGDMNNPFYFALTQHAIDAMMNAQCATLPLPQNMLGQNQRFTFLFEP